MIIRNQRVPSEYVEVEYIQSSGTQRIRIQLNAKANEFLEIGGSMQLLKATAGCIFSETSSTALTQQQCVSNWYSSSSTYSTMSSIFGTQSQNGGWRISHEEFTNFVLNTESIKTDLIAEKILPRPITKAFTYLDIFNRYGQSTYGISCRIKKLYLKQGTNITFNFVPVKKKSNNEYGLYDLVSKQFFGNLGTGSFTGGNEVRTIKEIYVNRRVPLEYDEVEYIENTSTSYINTSILPKNTIGIEIKASICPNNNTDNIIIGSRQSSLDTRFWIDMDWGVTDTLGWGFNKYTSTENRFSIAGKQGQIIVVSMNYFNDRLGKVNGVTYDNFNDRVFAKGIYPIIIFAANKYGEISLHTLSKIYYVNISNGQNIIMSLIPVKKKSNNEYGMYDLVSKQFYGNSGTGAFTGASPNKIKQIKNNGSIIWKKEG